MMTMGEKIRKLRKEKGFSLARLAEATASSKSYIWELENKNPPRPSADKIAKIAGAFGVTLDYFMSSSVTQPTDDVVDEAFFAKYMALPEATKACIRHMVDWGEAHGWR